MRRLAFLLILLVSLSTYASAQDTSALIAEQLDKQVDLKLDTTLPDALHQIADQTGVKIEAEQAVWDLLPWGQLTNLTIEVKNQTLREALNAITGALGLTYEVGDESVQLRPMPALRRLGRRATLQELQTLGQLVAPFQSEQHQFDRASALLQQIDDQLSKQPGAPAIDFRKSALENLNEGAFNIPRNATLLDALEIIHDSTDATWYPWGNRIVVVAKQDQVRRQLEKKIVIRYDGVDVAQVLTELSQKAGIPFSIEPGAIQRIAPEFRNVKLIFEDADIRQALETIAGFTGLGYVVKDDGVYIWNASSNVATTTPTRDPLVALIEVYDGVEVVVQESMISPELRDQLRELAKRRLESRQMSQLKQ